MKGIYRLPVGTTGGTSDSVDDLLISVQKARREVFHQLLGVEVEEVAKGLDGDDGAGDGILLRHSLLKKELQGFPGAATQIGKKIPVIEKIPPQRDWERYTVSRVSGKI